MLQDQVKVHFWDEVCALVIGFRLLDITCCWYFVIFYFLQDASASDPGNSTVVGSPDSVNHLKSSASGSLNSNNLHGSNSDITYHDDEGDGTGAGEDDDYVSDYDDNDDFLYDDGYMGMQSQFDKVDFPPGVEASLPWLNDRESSANIPPSTRTLTISDIPDSKKQAAATSSSSIPADSRLKEKVEESEDAAMQKLQQFKQFDIVDDFSDHHFSRMGFSDGKVMEVIYRYVYVVYFWKIV